MKDNQRNVLTALLCLCVLSAALLSAGCTQSGTQKKDATIPELKALNALAEDRLFSINWNAEHPGNIRSQLLGSETDFKNIFDILSAKSPTSEYESYTIYTMRTIDCTYIDMIAAMMDLTNVIEQNNNAEYYAAMYDSRYAGNASSPGISSKRPDISRRACAQRDIGSARRRTWSPIWR